MFRHSIYIGRFSHISNVLDRRKNKFRSASSSFMIKNCSPAEDSFHSSEQWHASREFWRCGRCFLLWRYNVSLTETYVGKFSANNFEGPGFISHFRNLFFLDGWHRCNFFLCALSARIHYSQFLNFCINSIMIAV